MEDRRADQDLIGSYRRGDASAFEALVTRHEAGLLRYVTRLSGDAALAQDVVQETFMTLVHQCRKPDMSPLESPRAWLYRVARNRTTDLVKKESRMRARQEAVAEHEAQPPDQHQPLEQHETECLIAKQLENIPAEVVEALSLKIIQGMSYREIATVTGNSLGKVSKLIHQGLTQLAKNMKTAEVGRGQE